MILAKPARDVLMPDRTHITAILGPLYPQPLVALINTRNPH